MLLLPVVHPLLIESCKSNIHQALLEAVDKMSLDAMPKNTKRGTTLVSTVDL